MLMPTMWSRLSTTLLTTSTDSEWPLPMSPWLRLLLLLVCLWLPKFPLSPPWLPPSPSWRPLKWPLPGLNISPLTRPPRRRLLPFLREEGARLSLLRPAMEFPLLQSSECLQSWSSHPWSQLQWLWLTNLSSFLLQFLPLFLSPLSPFPNLFPSNNLSWFPPLPPLPSLSPSLPPLLLSSLHPASSTLRTSSVSSALATRTSTLPDLKQR